MMFDVIRDDAQTTGQTDMIKSKKSKKKKNLREIADMLLEMEIPSSQEETRKMLKEMGVADEDMTYGMGIIAAMMVKALNGDLRAAKFIIDVSSFDLKQPKGNEEVKKKTEMIFYTPDNGRDEDVLDKVVKRA